MWVDETPVILHTQMTGSIKVVAMASSFIPKFEAWYGLNYSNFGIMV